MRKTMDVMLPRMILADQRLHATTKLVYMLLRSYPKNSIAHNAEEFKMKYETLRRSVRRLIELEWAYECRDPQTGRKLIVPWMPLALEKRIAVELERIGRITSHWGEWLMKAYLDLIVDDTRYDDNTRPSWVVSGDGSSRSEFDRVYEEARVAIEFQGIQHFQEVMFPSGRSNLKRQQYHDGLKALACLRQNYTFVEIIDIELSYETLVTKLNGVLPLIPPLPDRPIFTTLANMCHSYRNWAHKQRQNT